jgi:hypothetical protein
MRIILSVVILKEDVPIGEVRNAINKIILAK